MSHINIVQHFNNVSQRRTSALIGHQLIKLFNFRAQEPKAPVTYCDHALSVVCRLSVVRPSSVRKTIYIFCFFSRTAWWILMKLGMDEVLKVPYKCCCFSARFAKGRILGGAKIGNGGSPSSKNFLFRTKGYIIEPNAYQWSRSIWEEVLFFLVSFWSKIFNAFLASFWT